jgi:tRNA dimethylallyltransferase
MPLDGIAATSLYAGDTSRFARALEVAWSTGRTLTQWQEKLEGGIGGEIALRPILLLPPRPWLNARCDRRFEIMVDSRAVEEVRALLARNLDPQLPVMRAIGVPELSAFIEGHVTKAKAIEAGQQATRRYAKRQYTWFAHQPPPEWPKFAEPLEDESFDRALALLRAAE